MKRGKGLFLLFLIAGLLTMFLMPAAVMADSGEKIHLKFSTWHPPASREVKTVWKPMLAELEKRSNGRITTTLYAGGALGKGPEHFDIVRKGMSDMGYFTATWTPGDFR
jgi:TRAP-type C4-dicarboxylate transport system substrate-binding protein